MAGVLFLLENDYYPRDMRVYNECQSVSQVFACHVIAPRHKGQKFVEMVGRVKCHRYPHFEAQSLQFIFVEYFFAAFWISLLVPIITLKYRITVIHVANPPDFMIPLICWLKLFGRRIIYDIHDLSVETFRGKRTSRSALARVLVSSLKLLEGLSIRFADAIIVTNASVRDYIKERSNAKLIRIVRNSNEIRYRSIKEIAKPRRSGTINIGYFGVLADDEAAGLNNFFVMANALIQLDVPFKFIVVGDGPGLKHVQSRAKQTSMSEHFEFHGYVSIPQAFDMISKFDFGLVTWGDLNKNHLHTAMKVMDYMCCGVPVCSLRLKEQVRSTGNIGVHANTFEELARLIVAAYRNPKEYETLRRRTLDRFNKVLAWGYQEQKLREAYGLIFDKKEGLLEVTCEQKSRRWREKSS